MLTFYEISNNQFGSATRTIDLGGSIQRRGVALGADKTIAFSDQRIFVVASDDEVEGYSDFQGTIHDVVYSHDDIFYLLESTSTGHALVVTDAALAELGSVALNSVDFTESIVHGDVMANDRGGASLLLQHGSELVVRHLAADGSIEHEQDLYVGNSVAAQHQAAHGLSLAFLLNGNVIASWADNGDNSVSGIVNRGCLNPPCGTGPLDGGVERRDNFKKVLREFGLIP